MSDKRVRSLTKALHLTNATTQEFYYEQELVDVGKRKVYAYRPNVKVESLENPPEISGEPLLQDCVLNLKEIWE